MKNKLFLILIAFMLTSCESNEIIINRKTSGEKEDDPATLNNEVEGMVELYDGLYVSHNPGFYDEEFDLKFKMTDKDYRLLYSFDSSVPENNSKNTYSKPIHIEKMKIGNIENYPLTTSVDGILPLNTNGRCISTDYIYNVQKPENYYLTKKSTVLTIKLIDKNTNEQLFTRSLSYFVDDDIQNKFTIPVISLSMPYEDIFSKKEGFYNKPEQEIEKRANLEYLDPIYDQTFYRNTKIKIGGNWSSGYPQRTLNLNFNKNQFGEKNNPVKEKVFGDRKQLGNQENDLTDITRFRLHNGGNCFEQWTGLNDAIIQNLMAYTNASTTASRPCLTYINGEYWGLETIREHYSDVYYSDNYGVKKSNVLALQLKGNYLVDEGDENECMEEIAKLNEFVDNNDFTDEEVYNKFVSEYIDEDSFIDVMIAHSFARNWDFVENYNNLRIWKTNKIDSKNKYADGKWRFSIHDVDFAFTESTNFFNKNHANSYFKYNIFNKLSQNETFKKHMYQRAKYLLANNLSYDHAVEVIDDLMDQVGPYRLESYLRWGKDASIMTSWRESINNVKYIIRLNQNIYLSELYDALYK